MNEVRTLEGTEFDWFAIDRNGNVAILATAGRGHVPSAVRTAATEHRSIADDLDAPHWGTPAVWSDYAVIGLFVFDWLLPNGPYRLVARPSSAISPTLRGRITGLDTLPMLDLDFPKVEEIHASAWEGV